MSDLTGTRDHARKMAKKGGPDQPLWAQIADEIDAYLAGPDDVADLFGDFSVEPVHEVNDWGEDAVDRIVADVEQLSLEAEA